MKLGTLAWTAIRDALDSGRPVVAILPCGAVEAHGPHLPLETDVIISNGMADRAAAKLTARGIPAFVLPPLAYAPAEYAAAFAGTISIGSATAAAVLRDIAQSLRRQRFACLAIANSHFDPANVAMLRTVASEIAGTGLAVAYPDFTRRKLAQQLTDEFQSGACHAGQFETSLVMRDQPGLVDDGKRRALEENPSSLVDAFARGAKTFAEAGGPDAYFGTPQSATPAEGEQSYEIMADLLVEAVAEALSARDTSPR